MNKKTLFLSALVLLTSLFTVSQVARAVTLPGGEALFETSLQDRISSTDTSMTLVANSLKGGGSISGYHCFTLDEGRTDQEFICGTVTGTSVTGLERGISLVNGTSTVTGLQTQHRKGADVKIPDYPLIQRIRNVLNGGESLSNLLSYLNGTGCSVYSPNGSICDKAYIDTRVSAGAALANDTTAGLVQTASGVQAASTTITGATTARLALGSNLSTSSPGMPGMFVPVTQNNGKLSQLFLDLTQPFAWIGPHTFTATTTMAITSIASLASTYASTTNLTVSATSTENNIVVSGRCTGCTVPTTVTASSGPQTLSNLAPITATASCTAPQKVSGGGFTSTNNNSLYIYGAYPSAANSWTVSGFCNLTTCTSVSVTAYAICVNP